MSVVAFASVKASPGVTTSLLALAATWPSHRPLLLVEADADGGDLAARTGLPTEPGLASLAAAARRTLADGELDRHSQRLPGGLPAIVGPPDGDHASRALMVLGERLAVALTRLEDRDVLVDCGRLRPGSPAAPLAAGADLLVLVARPRLDELQHLRPALTRLATTGTRLALLLVGDQPYPPAEVAEALGVPVLAALPDDLTAAQHLDGQGRRADRLSRSPLLRAARDVAQTLAHKLTTAGEDPREMLVSGATPPAGPLGASREPSVSLDEQGEPSGWSSALTRSSRTPTETRP